MELKNWQEFSKFLEQEIEWPQYDVAKLKEAGQKNPVWLHFGGGNLYRGFHAEVAQRLANIGELKAGVIVCETFDEEVITKAYQPYHNDFLEVVMHEDGTLEKRIIATTAESYYCQPETAAYHQIEDYFKNPSLQFVTLTITEKGYGLYNNQNEFFPVIQEDIKNGPNQAKHTMSILTALLYQRFLANKQPLALVSTDNFSRNGERLQESVLTIAKEWQKVHQISGDFLDYLAKDIRFPWSMIDRITPNPSEKVKELLEADGFCDVEMIHTAKHTNIAPFVNTEAVNYLVIEDDFPNGRPALEKAGIILTDRNTVDKVDTMKVTTCLNPLHTALAITGCLFGYQKISDEMNDSDLVALVKAVGYQEGLPVVENPGIIQPLQFIDEVIQKRLPNPNIPDTPQRIASDTSQKVAIRFGETIKKYQRKGLLETDKLTFIPWVIAAWLRYLLAVDDQATVFTPSPDPLLAELQERLQDIHLGCQDTAVIHQGVAPILSNERIFGVNLYEANLGEKIEKMFTELLVGPGAVRHSLQKQLQDKGAY